MEGIRGRVSAPYEAELERTVQELKKLERQLEEALHQARPSAAASGARLSAKDSLEIMAQAYHSLAEAEPLLPPPGSVLPALLAMRRAQQTIAETFEYTDSQATVREHVERQIEAEQAHLRDQQALEAALQSRIQSLRQGYEGRQEKTEDQIARERIAKLRQDKDHWAEQTSSLMKQLDWFIGEHLGPMLAAEELGGPVVGDLMDIDPDDLSAGFNAHGKLKKTKGHEDVDKRQRRIDDIWGPRDEQRVQAQKTKRDDDEASAASAEMRDLIEQLMNKLVEAGGDNAATYVEIPRESAAARFLVRSKVAMFHPNNARKLRLVDFGRDLDD